jgi:hypothetical protein
MTKIDPNLETAWDIMTENPDVFSEEDLITLLERHLNYDIAVSLRGIDAIPPCYQYGPCEKCAYERYCRNQDQKSKRELENERDPDVETFREQLLENISSILLDRKPGGLE